LKCPKHYKIKHIKTVGGNGEGEGEGEVEGTFQPRANHEGLEGSRVITLLSL
jgi:hypothetical protein